jgi:integrase
MAKQNNIKTVAGREKLKPRREPYWEQLSRGKYLGFRVSSGGRLGAWVARYHDIDNGKKPSFALGDFGTIAAARRYDAAKDSAEEWFRHLDKGGSPERITVRQACQKYTDNPADIQRFDRHVYSDPIADIPLDKLRSAHVKAWRKRVAEKPAAITRSKKKKQEYRERSESTVNRDIAPLRAALNKAFQDDLVMSDAAWRKELARTKEEGRRDIYLSRDQRRALLEKLPSDDIRDFVRCLCLLPIRVGAVAALRVRDFNQHTNSLTVSKDKVYSGRQIPLQGDVVDLLRQQARNKHPNAYLFIRADGAQWNKNTWKNPIKAAALAAGLPLDTVAYTLRHCTITDLVQSGLDLFTVAVLAGTSVAMIEEHYAHLQKERAAQAISSLAL